MVYVYKNILHRTTKKKKKKRALHTLAITFISDLYNISAAS